MAVPRELRGVLPPGRCPRCAFPLEGGCLCPHIPSLRVPWRFLVLRHNSEVTRLTNTGRWAVAALAGAQVLDHARDEDPSDEAVARALGADPAWLLYWSPHARRPAGDPPRTIVVPDATWAQTRRMVQRIAPLRALPRLALPPPPSGPRLRRPPRAGGMSTLEAIAGALESLGAPAEAEALRRLHQVAVEKTLRLKGMWPPNLDHHP
jgi:DTW domain-containing protein YfiP